MTDKINLTVAVSAVFLTALIVFLERLFPFALFSKREPPALIRYVERFIPPMAIAALLIYSLKDVDFTSGVQNFVPQLCALAVTVALHLWRKNSMISIFGGTILYMILIRVL